MNNKLLLLIISFVVIGIIGFIIANNPDEKDSILVSDFLQEKEKSNKAFKQVSISYKNEGLSSPLSSSIDIVYISSSSTQTLEKEEYFTTTISSKNNRISGDVVQRSITRVTKEEDFEEEEDIPIDSKLYEKYRNIYPPSVPSEKLYNNFPPPPPQ